MFRVNQKSGSMRKVFVTLPMLLAAACTMEQSAQEVPLNYVEAGPNSSWEALYANGKEQLAAGYLGIALQKFKLALGKNPSSVKVLNGLAVTYDRFGRYELAELYYEKALALSPNSADLLNNVGYSYLLRERYEEALVHFDRAMANDPSPEIRRIVASNQRAAMDELRVVRQHKEKVKLFQASLAQQRAVANTVNCTVDRDVRISKSGERVHSLITKPGAGKTAAPAMATTADNAKASTVGSRDTRCATPDDRRVGVLKSKPEPTRNAKTSDFVRLTADGATASKSVPVEASPLPAEPRTATLKTTEPTPAEASPPPKPHLAAPKKAEPAPAEDSPPPSKPLFVAPENPEPAPVDTAEDAVETKLPPSTDTSSVSPAANSEGRADALPKAELPLVGAPDATPRAADSTGPDTVTDIHEEQLDRPLVSVVVPQTPSEMQVPTPTVAERQDKANEPEVAVDLDADRVTDILEDQTHSSDVVIAKWPVSIEGQMHWPAVFVRASLSNGSQASRTSQGTTRPTPSVLVVEVSNGAGRNNLAARTRQHFESRGLQVSYLTNAASYENLTTVIFYKANERELAEQFARQLPVPVRLEEFNDQYPHIRVRLGADILDFDSKRLYATEFGVPNA